MAADGRFHERSLQMAIDERHGGEAQDIRNRFRELSPKDKQALLTFLNSL
jgi:CxxC motif-containing protein (DUF1111 family)